MKYRTYRNTDLSVSEVGFGLWTISTGWWGTYTEGEALGLMRKAFDLGVTLFDAADTYGNGLSEEYLAKAFPNNRDEIIIATKIGYDFVNHGEERGRGQREIPQDFSPEALVRATDAATSAAAAGTTGTAANTPLQSVADSLVADIGQATQANGATAGAATASSGTTASIQAAENTLAADIAQAMQAYGVNQASSGNLLVSL